LKSLDLLLDVGKDLKMLHSQKAAYRNTSFARPVLLVGEDSGEGKDVGRKFGFEYTSFALAG